MKSFRTPEAEQALLDALRQLKDPQFRAAILDSLTTLGDPASVKSITPLLSDKNNFLRQRAAYAIGLIGGPDAEPALLSALAVEKHPHARTTELQGLSLCGSSKSVPALQAALKDPSVAVRAHAIQALRRIPGSEAKKALAQASEHDPALRKRIQEALQEKAKGAR